MAMDSTKAISGSYGKIYHGGVWLTNAFGIEASVEVSYEDIKRSGTRMVGHKAMSVSASGTINSYKMSNEFTKLIGQIMDDRKGAFVTEIHVHLDDPENSDVAAEWVVLKGVQFTQIPVINFEHGSLVEEELPFVYEGYEYI